MNCPEPCIITRKKTDTQVLVNEALRAILGRPFRVSAIGKLSIVNELSNIWASATLIIVADVRNKVVVTGGTKPAQINVDEPSDPSNAKKTRPMTFLKNIAVEICRARLGPLFGKIINECCRQYSEQAQKKNQINKYIVNVSDEMSEHEVEYLYNSVSGWPHSNEHSRSHKPSVYSWALDGHSFEAKPPCIRCTYLYPDWNMAKKPESTIEKKKALQSLRGHQMIYYANKSPPCGYCAETTAAAQLFALDEGTIICPG